MKKVMAKYHRAELEHMNGPIKTMQLLEEFYQWNHAGTWNQHKLKSTFLKFGGVIIPNLLSKSECELLLRIVLRTEKKSNQCSKIHSNANRKDMWLSIEDTKPSIKKIYGKIKTFVDELIPQGKIVENAVFISYPGAKSQKWHSDTRYTSSKEGNLVTFAIALTSHRTWDHWNCF